MNERLKFVAAAQSGCESMTELCARFSLELTALMGAAVDKTSRPEADTAKVLRVRGMVLMGEVEVLS